jgi:hypothetical protein
LLRGGRAEGSRLLRGCGSKGLLLRLRLLPHTPAPTEPKGISALSRCRRAPAPVPAAKTAASAAGPERPLLLLLRLLLLLPKGLLRPGCGLAEACA